jgi:hypothetical protein
MTDAALTPDDLAAQIEAANADLLGGDCPIRALGYVPGAPGSPTKYVFADARGGLRALSAADLARPWSVADLFFGDLRWLQDVATYGKREGAPPANKTPWNHSLVVPLLMQACQARGPFDMDAGRRGVGFWPGSEGRVIVHCGDSLRVASPRSPLGLPADAPPEVGMTLDLRTVGDQVDGVFYGRDSHGMAAPLVDDPSKPERVVHWLHDWLRDGWQWALPEVAPGLALGAAAVLAAPALSPRRPILDLVGPSGCGKSALGAVLQALAGLPILMKNPTAPGIRREWDLRGWAAGIVCDEYEQKAGENGLQALRDIARYAYDDDGARTLLGGAEGGVKTVMAAFAFIGIQAPPGGAADVNRTIRLRLRKLDVGESDAKAITAHERRMAAIKRPDLGAAFRARMLHVYPLLDDTIVEFKVALALAGVIEPRRQATIGVVLAWSWLLRHATLPESSDASAEVAGLGEILDSSPEVVAPEWSCLNRLLTYQVEQWQGGGKRTIAEYIDQVIRDRSDHEAHNTLKRCGVSVVSRRGGDWLAIAYDHQILEAVYRGSDWQNRGWSVLQELPGHTRMPNAVRFAPGTAEANPKGRPLRLMAYHLPLSVLDGPPSVPDDDPPQPPPETEEDGPWLP